jgi:hypothetical protein
MSIVGAIDTMTALCHHPGVGVAVLCPDEPECFCASTTLPENY